MMTIIRLAHFYHRGGSTWRRAFSRAVDKVLADVLSPWGGS